MVEMVVTGNPISRITSVCVLAMMLYLASHASGEYESREMSNGGSNDRSSSSGNDFSSCSEGKCVKRTVQEIANGMWFGPRLGKRRKPDVDKEDVNSQIEALTNALANERWALITIPGAADKRQPTQFIPRLGRNSEEESLVYDEATDTKSEFEENDHAVSPIFAPRLGRRPWTPSPRLGRRMHGGMQKM